MRWTVVVTVAVLVVAIPASAMPTDVSFQDGPQDPLVVPPVVDELGWAPPFPPDEEIISQDTPTEETACFDGSDDPAVLNQLVTMTNLTGQTWVEVWYVADPETSITNFDGWINGEEAFKIDNVGINRPLVFESIAVNNIFEVGETWMFIIQDYTNAAGGPPSAFDSIGVPTPGFPPSTGSIIAIVPEPATISLLGLGVLCLIRRRRSAAPAGR